MSNKIKLWAGRFGNNLQQVANAIMYSEYSESCFEQNLDHEIIEKFSLKFGENESNILEEFFCYEHLRHSKNAKEYEPCKTVFFTQEYVYKNMRRILKTYVLPKLKLLDKKIEQDTLVIHIRSGDIFCKDYFYWGQNYIQNPLCFYEKIISNFSKILIVTEPDNCNPIVDVLSKKSNVTIQSTTVCEDFSTLMSATNLVLSGVGTFGAAAALLSNNLKNLYVSNLYLEEHLNYKMIDTTDININVQNLKNYELIIDECNWYNTPEQRNYLLNYKMEN